MATTSLKDVSLGIRDIGNRTDFAGGAVTDLSAEEDRFINIALTEGYITPVDAFEVNEGAGATMNVVVGSGSSKADYYLVEGNGVGQGNYVVRLEGATETFSLGAADPSLARKDEVYIVVLDNAYDSSGKALAVLAVRQGDAAASPSAPGPDGSWDAYALLATVDVPAAASDILACTITDERVVSNPVMDVDAATLDGIDSSGFVPSSHVGSSGSQHAAATGSVAGFMSASDKTKLDGIESGAEVNPTNTETLTAVKAVDGAGSGLDADLLDGKQRVSVLDDLVKFNSTVVGADVSIGTSSVDHHSTTFTKPSGWTSYDLLVIAQAVFKDGSDPALISTQLKVGGGATSNVIIPLRTVTETASVVLSDSVTSQTGNVTVKMTSIRSGGTQAKATFTNYTFIAVRKS